MEEFLGWFKFGLCVTAGICIGVASHSALIGVGAGVGLYALAIPSKLEG